MKPAIKRFLGVLALFGLTFFSSRIVDAQTISVSDYAITHLSDNLCFIGPASADKSGGNNLVLVGEYSALLVDSDIPDNLDVFRQVVGLITEKPVRMAVNTHYHFDHVGANVSLYEEGAVIIAHLNTRRRMSVDIYNEDFGMTFTAAPSEAWPTVTFTKKQSVFFAGERIDLEHETAHTDTDTVLYLRNANVVHMGDIFFNHLFPVIDRAAGGGIDKMILAVRKVIRKIDDQTIVVPGHGLLADKASLSEYLQMLENARRRIAALIRSGASEEQAVADKPLAEYDSWSWSIIDGDMFTALVYRSLTERMRGD